MDEAPIHDKQNVSLKRNKIFRTILQSTQQRMKIATHGK